MPDKNTLISYTISVLALAVVLFFFDFGKVVSAISGFDYLLFFVSILLFFATFALRALAWREIAKPVAQIGFGKIFHITNIGFFANFILPLRVGEIIRSLLFSKIANVSRWKVLSTVIVTRAMEAVALVIFFIFGAIAFPLLEPSYTLIVVLSGIFFILLIALLVFPERFFSIAKKTGFTGLFPHKIVVIVKNFFTITSLTGSGKKNLALAFFYTILVWAIHLVAYWIVSFELGLDMSFFELCLVLSFSSLFSMIPSSPGSVGTFQAAFVAIFVALGLPAEKGLAMSIVLHLAIYLSVVVLGLLSIKSLSVSLSDYAKKAKSAFTTINQSQPALKNEG